MFQNRRILVGVGGGIAAYKICEVVSTLAKAGAEVKVILTDPAQNFVTPLTFATLSRSPAYTDEAFWHASNPRPLHIDLGEWAEVFLIAPLTANTLAKLAYGFADNLLTNTVLASCCPILVAPAMNTDMWQQQAVQWNWQLLQTMPRFHSIDPDSGILACDRVGQGRMAEPVEILSYLQSLLHTGGDRPLVGQQVLINTGGTREHLDPVRFIGNPATGKMGVALAQAALHRGATVTLVHAPMEPSLMQQVRNVRLISVTSAEEMRSAMLECFPDADLTLLAAAVADVRPLNRADYKLPKQAIPPALPLTAAPDIALELGSCKQPHQRLIGFAAQTGDILPPALEKLHRKKLDAIVANPVDLPEQGFGSDQNQSIFCDRHGHQIPIPLCDKLSMAHQIFDQISTLK